MKVPTFTGFEDTGLSPQTTSPNPKGDTDKETEEPEDARLPYELSLQQLTWENSMPDDAPTQHITQLASQKTLNNRQVSSNKLSSVISSTKSEFL